MRKSMALLLIMVFLATVFCTGCGQQSATPAPEAVPAEKTITDMAGNTVVVPANPERIAFHWANQYEIMMILGAADDIVAIHPNVKKFVWLVKYKPEVLNLPTPFADPVNFEELLKTDPDLVFEFEHCADTIDKCKELGLTVAVLSKAKSIKNIRENIMFIGQALGNEHYEKAKKYDTYFSEKLKMVNSIIAGIPDGQKPTVACIITDASLRVGGTDTIMDEWIEIAGGKNIAHEIPGYKVVDNEQLLKWNPDVIITPSNRAKNLIVNSPVFKELTAVKNDRVYVNPHGFFDWQYPSAEEALQIQWAAKTLHPDLFPNIDMRKEVKYYHQQFLGFSLTEEEIDTILFPEIYEAT